MQRQPTVHGHTPNRVANCRVFQGTFAKALGLALASCTSFEPGDDRLTNVQGGLRPSEEQLTPLDRLDPWACLEQLRAPGRESPDGGTEGDRVTLRVRYHSYADESPITENLEARVCNLSDVTCIDPVIDWQPSAPSGQIVALVPWGFSGYVEVRSPGYLPHIAPVDTPIYRDLELYSIPLIPFDIAEQIGMFLDIPFDPTLALVALRATDCFGDYASDVRIESNLPSLGTAYATSAGVPTVGETVTQRDGVFGFANAPTGLVQLSAYAPDGTKFDEQAMLLRAGTLTASYVRPRIWSVDQLCPENGTLPVPGTTPFAGTSIPCELLPD